MSEVADFLFVHAHLFTMQDTNTAQANPDYRGVGYIADGAVAVTGNKIVAVGTTAELTARFSATETIDASHQALLPGLIDAHMHTPLAIVRGVAQDVNHWMQKALSPYSRHMTPESSLAGVRLDVLEALKAGTTTLGDLSLIHI